MRLSLLLLCGSFSLASANAALAASWDVKFKDGRVVTVEAPVGANDIQIGILAIEKLRAQNAKQAVQNEVETKKPNEIELAVKEEPGALTEDEKAEILRKSELYLELYMNCYIDKVAGVSNERGIRYVEQRCMQIAKDPSFFQKWKYSN